jgi:hypothetical protein
VCPVGRVPCGAVPTIEGDAVSEKTGTAKRGAKPTEDAELLAQQAREEEEGPEPVVEGIDVAEPEPAAETVDAPVAPEPASAAASSDLAAILAANNAAMMQAVELLAEKLAGQGGREVQIALEGPVEDLVRQLAGTVSDGGDGEDPLPAPVTFVARGAMFKAIKKPRYRGVGPTGEQIFTTGVAADFAPTGMFSTRNREMAEWLRGRPGFNVDFWEQGAEPFSAPDPKT